MRLYYRSICALVADGLSLASVAAETVALCLEDASTALAKKSRR